MSTTNQLIGAGPVLPKPPFSQSPAMKWCIGVIGLLVIITLVFEISLFFKDADRFPVSKVLFIGTADYADREQLEYFVEEINQQGYFGTNLRWIQERVEQLPWIASAHISRVWPSTIEIEINEHEPAVRWNKEFVISKQVQLLEPPQLDAANPTYLQWYELFSQLPALEGPAGRHGVLLESFRKYNNQLQALGVTVVSMKEDDRLSQTLYLSNEVKVKLGYERQAERMIRFVDVFARLHPAIERVEAKTERGLIVFDMRYSNGFSLNGLSRAQITNEPDSMSSPVLELRQ